MTLIGFASGRSPGLTTLVHVLALMWPPPRRALIAELDPDGGTLAARHAVAPDPGLLSLAAAGRRGLAPQDILGHCQRLADGTPALLGPSSPDRAAPALTTIAGHLAPALGGLAGWDVLADCGRLEGRSPAAELLGACQLVVLVTEPSVEGVAHLAARLAGFALPEGAHGLISVGGRPYRPAEVADALGLPLLGTVARDPRGAARLADGDPDRRGSLLRSGAAVARELCRRLPAVDACDTTGDDEPGEGPGRSRHGGLDGMVRPQVEQVGTG